MYCFFPSPRIAFFGLVTTLSGEMNILSLDLGGKTGWAVFKDGSITSGTEVIVRPNSGQFSGGGVRFLNFKNFISKKIDLNAIGVVYFEEVRKHSSTAASHAYGGYLAHLTAMCEEIDVPYIGVSVGTIKKHATGKGNAKKREVIDAITKLGFKPKDDNEADSLALMMYALER